jgi:hypothetical protein
VVVVDADNERGRALDGSWNRVCRSRERDRREHADDDPQ